MAEDLHISTGNRADQYGSLLPQIRAIIEGETDFIANLANTAAALKEQFDWHWVGFYLVQGNELVVGPFQGPVACTRIRKGKGVCGTSWEQARTLIVPDVEAFPGHIACSSLSRSEIVIPIFAGSQAGTTHQVTGRGEVIGVLDIDSRQLDDFDETDRENLEKLTELIGLLQHRSK